MSEEQKKAEANESENNASNTTEETAKQVEKDAAKQSADKKESESKEAKAAARPEAEAKKAAAARPERAKPSAAKKKDAEEEKPKPPSPNQPLLDRIVEIIRKEVSEDAVQEAFINEMDRHLPCIVIDSSRWVETSKLLKEHDQLSMVYLRNVTGVDYETHFEVVYHLLSMERLEEVCIKVRTDRENPSVPSVTPVWETANWNEREIYDLLGIDFPGHPNLTRIMMPDDWIGHPLRKDYEPFDPEV